MRYSEILADFTYPVSRPRWGRPHCDFAKIVGVRKLSSPRYRTTFFARFFVCLAVGRTPTCDRRTDGWTQDRSINRASMASRGKSEMKHEHYTNLVDHCIFSQPGWWHIISQSLERYRLFMTRSVR